jgi:serine/threonine protein kinase
MHRDIKGGNILLTKEGILKIADFGLARDFKRVNSHNFTVKVVTRWYRAPELLLNQTRYNEKIDVWSIGCFIAEMFIGKPLFPG